MKEKIYHFFQSPYNKSLIDISICGITYPDKNYSITRKNSLQACIEYVEKGSGVITAGDLKYVVYEGDTYFMQLRQNQHYYADSDTPWKKYFLNVSGPLLESLVEGYRLDGHIYYPQLDIKKELLEIIGLAKGHPVDHTAEVVCILNKIFHKMTLTLSQVANLDSPADKMREFLDMNAAEKFHLEDLCKYVSLSESQTIRVFKKAYKTTPYAYFMAKKFELAKNMLLNTTLSIKQIAHELNYADEYYFSNTFKQKEGISPKKYKKCYSNNSL